MSMSITLVGHIKTTRAPAKIHTRRGQYRSVFVSWDEVAMWRSMYNGTEPCFVRDHFRYAIGKSTDQSYLQDHRTIYSEGRAELSWLKFGDVYPLPSGATWVARPTESWPPCPRPHEQAAHYPTVLLSEAGSLDDANKLSSCLHFMIQENLDRTKKFSYNAH
jgi:hypothetical protein